MKKILGVIGAGTMGNGIASTSALNGFETIVHDVSFNMLEKAQQNILRNYDKLEAKRVIDESRKRDAISKLKFVTDFNSLAGCEFVIEAATENLELKKEIFRRLDIITEPDAVLATNTSSLSVTSISSAAKKYKSRVVGMHFFNPANLMKLVEVIRGTFTSDETLNKTIELSRSLGKTPVVCKDTPAFIVNRVARPFYLESLRILSEGELGVEDIDRIIREEGGFKMGPFELMDLIGIDINYSVTKSVYEALACNPKYEPHPIQKKMIEDGMLGRKTGKGFYSY